MAHFLPAKLQQLSEMLCAEIQGLVLGPNEWPGGCLGYAFNLVRPVLKGHRCSLLYPVLGQTLVELSAPAIGTFAAVSSVDRFTIRMV